MIRAISMDVSHDWIIGGITVLPSVLGWMWAAWLWTRAWVPLSQSEYIELMPLSEDEAVGLAGRRGYRHDWDRMQWLRRRRIK